MDTETTLPDHLIPTAILWGEGYLLSAIVVCGVASNIFLQVLIRNRELNLIKTFASLLQVLTTGYSREIF